MFLSMIFHLFTIKSIHSDYIAAMDIQMIDEAEEFEVVRRKNQSSGVSMVV